MLDHGFIRLIDYMGDDSSVTNAARMSYTNGTTAVNDDRTLLRHLMREYHTGPFEMCEVKFHLKVPMFIGEQILRHRTANVNKESGRYSILSEDKYVPDASRIAKQSKTNKQGSGDGFELADALAILGDIEMVHTQAQAVYERHTSEDVDLARELARGILPANQYAEFYWKIDLSNLLKFLQLRLDHHAQWEIREYARIIHQLVSEWVPLTYEAFADYRLNAITFSGPEVVILKATLKALEYGEEPPNSDEFSSLLSKREWRELVPKLNAILKH